MTRPVRPKGAALISVIVPAHNAAATILETIESIRCQTFSDFEIVVIDDESTDGTLARLGEIEEPRMRVVSYRRGGLAAARNRGIEQARGEFISFIDADDLWTPEKLEFQLDALLDHPEAGVAYSWTVFIDQGGRFLFAKERLHFEGDVHRDLLRGCFIASGSNVLMSRRCVEDVGWFDAGLASAEDWDYWLRASERWPFVVVPRYHVLYRFSVNSMSSDVRTIEADSWTVLDRALAKVSAGDRRLRAESQANLKQYASFLHLARARRPDRRAAAIRLVESVRLYPRILLGRKARGLLWACIFVALLPPGLTSWGIRLALRVHGRLMLLVAPGLRDKAILDRL